MKYILFILSYYFSKFIIPLVEQLFKNSNYLKENYKGTLIPCSMGIIYVFNMLCTSIFLFCIYRDNYMEILIFVLGIVTMGFVGFIDDLIGDRKITGFKGHIKMLIKKKLTTGGLKAVIGGIVSILISFYVSTNMLDFILNFMIISLFTNFVNLLDLRPGRALKTFMLFSIIFIIILDDIYELILFSFLGVTLAYLPYDLKAKSMLGDIGSNCLGIFLGIVATSLNISIKIVLMFFLILAHIYSEKYSISNFISKNRILKYIDEFGR